MHPLERQYPRLAGVDEAGRGPLAGPVSAAAVILDPLRPIPGLADSKKLSEKKRETLFPQIQANSVDWSIAFASPEEIDELNILQASMLAMRRALEGLSVAPEHVAVDGNRIPDWAVPSTPVVGGDRLLMAISAASILAKVARDKVMLEYHNQYPEFGFDSHKGYPTKAHQAVLANVGPTPIHRRSFAPVRRAIQAGG